MDLLIEWLSDNTVSIAILGGVVGFLAKVAHDLWSARREERLERVNRQLKLLYGPLYALNQTSGLAWTAFRSNTRPGGAFFGDPTKPPPSEHELEAWRRWMLIVFKPVHERMRSIITKNADLLIEDDLPYPLQLFSAHVAAYKVVFEQWAQNDFSEHTSVMNYPGTDLERYLQRSFAALKAEQARLIGSRYVSRRYGHGNG